jgi:hypothetical protein
MNRPSRPAASPAAPATASADAPRAPARRRALATLGSAGLLAAGCGGGTDLAGVGSGGTGQSASSSFSAGAISGFGSVIVNGIRFDDTAATVTDDLGGTRTLGQLGIGMVVEVDGSSDDTTGLGVARAIRVVSEATGPIESVDAAAGRFVMLGMTVQTGAATVWEDARGIGSVAAGSVVEAWGFLDRSTGILRASRIELRPAGTSGAKLRGPVAGFDATARSFRIGTQWIDARDVALPAGFADGTVAVVSGSRPAAGAPWRPDRVAIAQVALAATVTVVRLEGTVAGFQSAARFELAGLSVDATDAVYSNGTAATLRNGLRVRVTGVASGGRVLARRLEVRSDDDDGSSTDEAEIKGTITRFGRIADFTVRDALGRLFLVDATLVTRYDGLSAADLRIGLSLRVKGRAGTILRATEIRLER